MKNSTEKLLKQGKARRKAFRRPLAVILAALMLSAAPVYASQSNSGEGAGRYSNAANPEYRDRVQTLVPAEKRLGNERDAECTYSYNSGSGEVDSQYRGIKIPVKVSGPGSIKIKISAVKLGRAMTAYMYTDRECTNKLAHSMYISQDSEGEEAFYDVEKGGVYYFYCKSFAGRDFTGKFSNSFKVSSSFYPKGERVIRDNLKLSYYCSYPGEKFLFKYVPPKNGFASVTLPYYKGSRVTLLGGGKKPLSPPKFLSEQSEDGFRQEFYVQKGKTYYFAVTSNGADEQFQTIKVRSHKIKNKGGRSMEKAAAMNKKKKRGKLRGMLANGGRKAKWYKFTSNGRKNPRVVVNSKVNGALRASIYDKSGKNITRGRYVDLKGASIVTTNSFRRAGKPCMYYLKVFKAGKLSGGRFTLRVN